MWEGDLEAVQQGFSDKPGPEFMALALNYFINFIHTHQVLSLVHLPPPIYSAVAFFPTCSVLYSCATEEGPFRAETFCLLVKKCTTCLTLKKSPFINVQTW